jgi:hypothetical protein
MFQLAPQVMHDPGSEFTVSRNGNDHGAAGPDLMLCASPNDLPRNLAVPRRGPNLPDEVRSPHMIRLGI